MQSEGNKRQAHSNFNFAIAQGIHLHICSDFDSGNLQSAVILDVSNESENLPTISLDLVPAIEPFNPNYSNKPSTKAFFHFHAKATNNVLLHIIIKRMNILSYVQGSFDEYYRLCIGKKPNPYLQPQYEKIKPEFMKLNKNGQEYSLEFKYFLPAQQRLYFAYHYPYSVEKQSHYLHTLSQQIRDINQSEQFSSNQKHIYYRNQLLIESVESRPINLLTITQIYSENVPLQKNNNSSPKKEGKMSTFQTKNSQIKLNLPRQPRISRSLFPYYDIQERPYKFSKPYILVTCRVHPGQTSASYALQGFINKLIKDTTPQIQFIRKSFVFLIIPMVNPDGVYHGTYRMDTLGHNLNRFYNNCLSHKQPSIFAIQNIMSQCSEDILSFFDIHSHPQLKGSFFYGNAYQSIYDQIQSQVFAKLLSFNSECFGYEMSSFSQRNMNSKDINQTMTKDGSARVSSFRKIPNNIHCYTIQMGYHGAPIKKQILGLNADLLSFKSNYRRTIKQFYQIDYMEHGAAVLNSIAQIYIRSMNSLLQLLSSPPSPTKSQYQAKNQCPIAQLRQELGKQINQKEERFKMMDGGINKKLKTSHSTILTNFYMKILKKYPIIEENIQKYNSILNGDNGSNTIESFKMQPIKSGLMKQYKSQTLKNSARTKQRQVNDLQSKKESQLSEQYDYFIQRNVGRNKISVARQYTRVLKQKINITPFEFEMPRETKRRSHGKNRDQSNIYHGMNNALQLNFDSLPKISKKPPKILSQRHKALRQRNATSLLNKNQIQNKMPEPPQVHFNKMTIDNQLGQIIGCQAFMNYDNQCQFRDQQLKIHRITELEHSMSEQQTKQDQSPFTHKVLDMNILHPGMMYKRTSQRISSQSKNYYNSNQRRNIQQNNTSQSKNKIIKSYQTQRLTRHIRNRQRIISSNHRQKATSIIEVGNNSNINHSSQSKDVRMQEKVHGKQIKRFNDSLLPKLDIKMDSSNGQKLKNKFDLQLKMREKYEKQYNLFDNWKKDQKNIQYKIQ